ncbi:MAG: hypothetical protein ABI883_04360 [Chthoniobacterales bacterium]
MKKLSGVMAQLVRATSATPTTYPAEAMAGILSLICKIRMPPWTSVVVAMLAAELGACVTSQAGTAISLRSQRRNVSVSVRTPAGFSGPVYRVSPSYDLFSFGHGREPTICYLQVRFDRERDEPSDRHSPEDIAIHWNRTPLVEIRQQYKREFQNPRVDYLITAKVAGKPARVHAVYDADGYFFAAEILRAGTVISFELRSPNRRELERHKASFLSFLRSLGIP